MLALLLLLLILERVHLHHVSLASCSELLAQLLLGQRLLLSEGLLLEEHLLRQLLVSRLIDSLSNFSGRLVLCVQEVLLKGCLIHHELWILRQDSSLLGLRQHLGAWYDLALWQSHIFVL